MHSQWADNFHFRFGLRSKRPLLLELTVLGKWGCTQSVWNSRGNVRWWCWCRRHWAASKMWKQDISSSTNLNLIMNLFFVPRCRFSRFVRCLRGSDAGRCHRKIIIIDWSLMLIFFALKWHFLFCCCVYFALIARSFVCLLPFCTKSSIFYWPNRRNSLVLANSLSYAVIVWSEMNVPSHELRSVRVNKAQTSKQPTNNAGEIRNAYAHFWRKIYFLSIRREWRKQRIELEPRPWLLLRRRHFCTHFVSITLDSRRPIWNIFADNHFLIRLLRIRLYRTECICALRTK